MYVVLYCTYTMKMNDGDFSNFLSLKLFVRFSLHWAYWARDVEPEKRKRVRERERKKERKC